VRLIGFKTSDEGDGKVTATGLLKPVQDVHGEEKPVSS
jgi:hypothetical protein